MENKMKITAHRGFSSLAPENTLAAMKEAINYGCKWIEIDVQLSADHVPMVIHDKTVNRCSNGKGEVRNLSKIELKQLDAGSWFSDDFNGESIPTLEEVLLLTSEAKVALNIELKIHTGDCIHLLCEKVAEVISKLNIEPELMLFSSFDQSALLAIKQHLPHVRRGQLWETIPNNHADVLSELDAFSVHCDYRYLTEEKAKAVKRLGYQLYCYTPNQPELVEDHWLWGVDMMITDTPHRYLA